MIIRQLLARQLYCQRKYGSHEQYTFSSVSGQPVLVYFTCLIWVAYIDYLLCLLCTLWTLSNMVTSRALVDKYLLRNSCIKSGAWYECLTVHIYTVLFASGVCLEFCRGGGVGGLEICDSPPPPFSTMSELYAQFKVPNPNRLSVNPDNLMMYKRCQTDTPKGYMTPSHWPLKIYCTNNSRPNKLSYSNMTDNHLQYFF